MSTEQRFRRTAYAALSGLCGAIFVAAAGWLAVGAIADVGLFVVVWASGLAGLGFAVAACGVEDDATDDPEYFASIVHGLREEWQRLSG